MTFCLEHFCVADRLEWFMLFFTKHSVYTKIREEVMRNTLDGFKGVKYKKQHLFCPIVFITSFTFNMYAWSQVHYKS